MVFADPGAVYIRIGSFLLLMTLGYSDVGLTTSIICILSVIASVVALADLGFFNGVHTEAVSDRTRRICYLFIYLYISKIHEPSVSDRRYTGAYSVPVSA